MSDQTKITLSVKELELVCNKEWILTKHVIIEKVYQLFGILAESMQQHIHQNKEALPAPVIASNPKISRGENYKKLPYVMLDYPRQFTKESTLAIRTLFWWGNFFSISLHLSGKGKETVIPALKSNFKALQQNDYWVCIHDDPWQHYFEEDNYVRLKNYTEEEFATILHRETFFKIAKRTSLKQWETAAVFLEQHFEELVSMLKTSSPNDERGLSPGIPKVDFDL